MAARSWRERIRKKLIKFKKEVLSRMVRFWRDPRDIKLAILETMSEFSRREDLMGWIPGSESVNTGAVAEEMARLAKENAELRQQVATMSPDATTFNGLSFDQMYKILREEKANLAEFPEEDAFMKVAESFGDSEPGLIHMFWLIGRCFRESRFVYGGDKEPRSRTLFRLEEFGLTQNSPSGYYVLTETGRQFLLRLRLERETERAEELVGDNPIFRD